MTVRAKIEKREKLLKKISALQKREMKIYDAFRKDYKKRGFSNNIEKQNWLWGYKYAEKINELNEKIMVLMKEERKIRFTK